LPKELNINEFLKTLKEVENKEQFLKHLETKNDAKTRLAYLNLVEPTLKDRDIELIFPNKTENILKPLKILIAIKYFIF